MQIEAFKSAKQVRCDQKLPEDGRDAFSDLARLEKVFRDVLSPDVPSFDVNSVQEINFDEWIYTEGLGCFMAFTQSVEINARLMWDVVFWPGPIEIDFVELLKNNLKDKWALEKSFKDVVGKKVFFPPGNNLGFIINTDNVLRAFHTDPRWMLKPHPVTSDADVHQAKLAFGATHIYDKLASGMSILRACDTIGYTTSSEMGLMGIILDKKTINFSKFEFESCGRYHPIYEALRDNTVDSKKETLNKIFNCPWSGIIPLDTPDDEAAERFRQYKVKTIEKREIYSPMVYVAKSPKE